MESAPLPENAPRSREEVDSLADAAINEVLDLFKDSISDSDKKVFEVAAGLQGGAVSRIGHMVRVVESEPWNEDLKGYVNQILQTLRQRLTDKERERFTGWAKERNLLEEIN